MINDARFRCFSPYEITRSGCMRVCYSKSKNHVAHLFYHICLAGDALEHHITFHDVFICAANESKCWRQTSADEFVFRIDCRRLIRSHQHGSRACAWVQVDRLDLAARRKMKVLTSFPLSRSISTPLVRLTMKSNVRKLAHSEEDAKILFQEILRAPLDFRMVKIWRK